MYHVRDKESINYRHKTSLNKSCRKTKEKCVEFELKKRISIMYKT